MKDQGDSSFPAHGHKAILNKMNNKSKTNRKRIDTVLYLHQSVYLAKLLYFAISLSFVSKQYQEFHVLCKPERFEFFSGN